MAIYKSDIVDINLNSGNIYRNFRNNAIGEGDSLADRFGVRAFRDGEPVSLESSVVAGVFIAPDGNKYGINETSYPGSTGKSGNTAWVQLPPICYAVKGQYTLAIKVSSGSVEGTLRIVDGIVSETGEAGAVVPTSTIPTTEEIIAAYEEAVAIMGGSVRFDAEQTLSDSEKETARNNIGSIGEPELSELEATLEGEMETLETELGETKGDVDNFVDGYIDYAVNNKTTPSTVNEGYWLSSNGSGVEHSGYNIYRFPVVPGNNLLFNIGKSESPTVWVYKSANTASEDTNVGVCQTSSGIVWSTVPANAKYVFIALPSENQYSVSVQPIKSTIEILTGPVFMYMANGKINVKAGSTSRIGIDGTYYVGSEWNGSFAVSDNTVHFLCLNTSGWYIRKAPLKPTDAPVAVAYQNRVYADDGNIITNHLPIDNLYQREDIPVFINEKRAGYPLKRVLSKIDSFGYFYRLVNCYTVDENVVTLVDSAGRPVAMPDSKMHQNATDISNKKILAIGDSITNRGWWQKRIKDYVPSVDFVGTRDTQHNNLKCEGYSGKNTNNVLRSSTITLINGTTIPNPFWNPSTSEIDFAYYCTNNNIDPDYVVIEFGLNESNAVAYRENVQFFIDKIMEYSQTIKIYVVQPFNVAKTQATVGQNTVASMQAACDMCTLESSSFTDCVLIPCWYILVDEYDYESDDVDYGIGTVTVPGVADAIHPSESIGFAKIGDQIYNYLGL